MKVVSIDSKSGKEVATEVLDPSPSFFSFVDSFELTDAKIKSQIDCINTSADTKAMLYSFSKATIKVGKAVVKIGRKLLDIIFSLIRTFPNITFGMIFGLVVGALVAAIPIIGFVLGTLATTIAVAFGFIVGAKADLESGKLGDRIDSLINQFAPLRA